MNGYAAPSSSPPFLPLLVLVLRTVRIDRFERVEVSRVLGSAVVFVTLNRRAMHPPSKQTEGRQRFQRLLRAHVPVL